MEKQWHILFLIKILKYSYKPNLKIQYEENYKLKDNKMPKIKNTL